MSNDMTHVADVVSDYAKDPSHTSRKLVEDTLNQYVGTDPAKLTEVANLLESTGTLPRLAVVENQAGSFGYGTELSKDQMDRLSQNSNSDGLTRLAALEVSKNFDAINNTSYNSVWDCVSDLATGWGTKLGGNVVKMFSDHSVNSDELLRYAQEQGSKPLPNDQLGFGDLRRVDTNLSTNVELDKSVDANLLIHTIGDSATSPAQRLQAAYALHEKGQNSFTLVDGANGEINVSIQTDKHGNIGLWANEGGKPYILMRGVVRNGEIAKQGESSYFGTKWSKLHPGTTFTP